MSALKIEYIKEQPGGSFDGPQVSFQCLPESSPVMGERDLMTCPSRFRRGCATAALLLAAGAEKSSAQAANPCAGQTACTDLPAFVVVVTNLRPGSAGTSRSVSLTIRFTNKTPRALVMGYVDASGMATDDRGNRYLVGQGAVGSIGVISSASFDPKFTLQPGESGEGRIEFAWAPSSGSEVAGTVWDVGFTIREIDPVADKQYKLGKEHVLQFRGLRATAVSPD